MSGLTSIILSGVIYDGVIAGVAIGVDFLKEKLRDWVIDDVTLSQLASKIATLEIDDELAPKGIERRIENCESLMSMLKNVTTASTSTINQIHHGHGDNIGRDKIINSSKS